jgi:hypothetical protein
MVLQASPQIGGAGVVGLVPLEEVKRAEEFLRRRMGLRVTVNAKQIMEEAQTQVLKEIIYFVCMYVCIAYIYVTIVFICQCACMYV